MERTVFKSLYKVPSRNGLNRPSSVRGVGYKMINMGEIFGSNRIHDIEMERVLLNEKEKVNFKVEKNDLLFARQSIVAEGAGKCSIVLDTSDLTCFESHIIRVRLNEDVASPEYFFYFFQSEFGKAYLSTIRQQGVQAGIRGSDLEKLKLPVPSLPIQRKIASILSAYDDLIENNLKRIQLLEEISQLIYEEWFESNLIDGKIISEKNFEYKPLEELIEFSMNGGWGKETRDNNHSETAYVIRGTDIPDVSFGQFSDLPLRFHTKKNLEARVLMQGDLIIEISNGNINNVGRSFFFDESVNRILNEKVICASFCKMLRPKSKELSFIIAAHIKYIHRTDKMLVYKSQGANGINNFRSEDMINEEELPIPKGKLLDLLVEKLETRYNHISNLRHQIKLLKEARDILLPRLMTGMIEV